MKKKFAPDNVYYYMTKSLILIILIWHVWQYMEGGWKIFFLAFFGLMILAIPAGAARQTILIDEDSVEGSFGRKRVTLPRKGLQLRHKKLLFKKWTMLTHQKGRIFIPHELFKYKTLEEMLNCF